MLENPGPIQTGVYRHYKGKDYQVLGVAHHTETGERMVVYRGLYKSPDLEADYGPDPIFVRPYDMFFEDAVVDGVVVPRFRCVED